MLGKEKAFINPLTAITLFYVYDTYHKLGILPESSISEDAKD